tara:strand:+ start:732 stop:1640 length:909 start_codon:yes stop_codon:yes gene_type:complete
MKSYNQTELEDAIHKFILYCSNYRNLSPYTIRNYKNDLLGFDNFIKTEKKYHIDDLDRSIVRKYIKHLNNLDYKRSSINRKLSVLRVLFRYISTHSEFGNKDLIMFGKSKSNRNLPKILNNSQMKDILDSVDISTFLGLRNRTLLELMYSTGLRVSELSSINKEDILNLQQIKIIGKGSKVRVVYINDQSKKFLNNYLNIRNNKNTKTDSLFINKYGERLSVRSIQKIVKKHGHKAGLDLSLHPHMLRHTFATQMLSNGADLRTVQTLLGHAKISTTQIYTHVANKDMEKSYFNFHPRVTPR